MIQNLKFALMINVSNHNLTLINDNDDLKYEIVSDNDAVETNYRYQIKN